MCFFEDIKWFSETGYLGWLDFFRSHARNGHAQIRHAPAEKAQAPINKRTEENVLMGRWHPERTCSKISLPNKIFMRWPWPQTPKTEADL